MTKANQSGITRVCARTRVETLKYLLHLLQSGFTGDIPIKSLVAVF
nr:MAG TPA: hypothetical protein [Herelleviridae sp.]